MSEQLLPHDIEHLTHKKTVAMPILEDDNRRKLSPLSNKMSASFMTNNEIHADIAIETQVAPLRDIIKETLDSYFSRLGSEIPLTRLYDFVIKEVEIPLLQTALGHTNGNQFKAASLLGISRNTLRRKLTLYQLDAKS